MKQYRLDENPVKSKRKPLWDEEEETRTKVWVEETVKIFGEIHCTEKYSLMSRNKLKKLGIYNSWK